MSTREMMREDKKKKLMQGRSSRGSEAAGRAVEVIGLDVWCYQLKGEKHPQIYLYRILFCNRNERDLSKKIYKNACHIIFHELK